LRLILLFAAFTIIGLAIESAFPHVVSFRPLIPNLIIILAVDLGMRHHGVLPAIVAFGMGYATDALAGSHPGLNAFMMTLVFLASYEISTRLMTSNSFVGAVVVFFSVIGTTLGTIAMADGAKSITGSMMPSLMLGAFISAIVAPLIFSMLSGAKRLTGLPASPGRERP
jgi:rod shape-determining protein MreD